MKKVKMKGRTGIKKGGAMFTSNKKSIGKGAFTMAGDWVAVGAARQRMPAVVTPTATQ